MSLRPGGFSLLELMIVLFVIALFLGVLSVRIENALSGGDLALASRTIINEITRLRGEAAATRENPALGIDLDEHRFYAIRPTEIATDSAEVHFMEKDPEDRTTTALPEGVMFEDVVILATGKVQEGEARIRFFPNGTVERSLIHLRNEKDDFYTLEINPLTGRVKLHDTYIDQKMLE